MYIIEPGGFSKEYIKNMAIKAPNKWEDFDWFDNSASQMPDKKPKIMCRHFTSKFRMALTSNHIDFTFIQSKRCLEFSVSLQNEQ